MQQELMQFISWAVQALVTAFAVVLWFNLRDIKSKAELNTADLAGYKLHVAETYITENELSKAIQALSKSVDAIFTALHRIEDKLDNKEDKK